MRLRPQHRKQPEPPHLKTIDATAGPPTRPLSDPAIDDLAEEQHGRADAEIYDGESFVNGTDPLAVRAIKERYRSRAANSRIEERDDEEFAGDNLADARTRLAAAQLHEERLEEESAEAIAKRDVLAEKVGADPGRREESPRVTLAWMVLVPVLALVIEVPWSYYALQVLGEPTTATAAMAVLFGFLGVLLAELGGVSLRRARRTTGGERWALWSLAGGSAAVLCLLGVFLAELRTAFLAASLPGAGSSALATFGLGKGLVFVGWLAANAGLWLGIGALAYLHHLPGLRALQRADARVETLTGQRPDARTEVAAAVWALGQSARRAADVPFKWDQHRRVLFYETQRSIALYGDGLAHAKTSPEFTTALELHQLSDDLEVPTARQGEEPGQSPGSGSPSNLTELRSRRATRDGGEPPGPPDDASSEGRGA